MTQAYAVLFANDGSFMLAFKAARGYYFGDGADGDIYVNGKALNGGYNYAFPGGEKNPNESILNAAAREFYEETAYAVVNTYGVASWSFGPAYGAGYFRAYDTNQVTAYVNALNGTSLPNSWAIANAIQAGQITAYNQIPGYVNAHNLNPWAETNELQYAWNLNILDPQTWQWVQTWANPNSGLDWYYNILAYLRHDILGWPLTVTAAPVPDRMLQLRDGSYVGVPEARPHVPTPTGEGIPELPIGSAG